MITDEIRAELYHLQDIKYRDFQSKRISPWQKEYLISLKVKGK